MKLQRRSGIALLILVSLLATACPKTDADKAKSFARGVRTISAMVVPLIDSLVASGAIKPELRATYIKDGLDVANGTANLADDIADCADNPCRVAAVDKFQGVFFEIVNRGNFSKVGKLAKVQSLIEGLIASARVYFGAAAKRGETYVPLDKQLEALKQEMKP